MCVYTLQELFDQRLSIGQGLIKNWLRTARLRTAWHRSQNGRDQNGQTQNGQAQKDQAQNCKT